MHRVSWNLGNCHTTVQKLLVRRQQQQQRPFNGLWSGTTQVGRYQKRHSPTHTHPDHRASFIIFLHLQRSMASSFFNLRAWQSSRTTSFQVFFLNPQLQTGGLCCSIVLLLICLWWQQQVHSGQKEMQFASMNKTFEQECLQLWWQQAASWCGYICGSSSCGKTADNGRKKPA